MPTWPGRGEVLGPGAIIGVSCYNEFARAVAAQRAGADYVAFGSFFPSPTKPQAVRAGMELLERARRELALPVVAIGGITPENGRQLVEAGADMLAVIHGVFGQPDVRGRLPPSMPNVVRTGGPSPMSRSHDRFAAAQRHIPGGVNSPVRAFKGVGGDPVFVDSAAGPYIFDPDGKRYIDYVGSWGPMILGPCPSRRDRGGGRGHPQGAVLRRAHRDRDARWPTRCASWCRASSWCAWSPPAPRPP